MIPNAIRVFEQQRKVISARAGVTAQQLWRRVDPTQVDASMQVIRQHLVRALQGYRRQAAIAAAAYTPALLRETRLATEPVGELNLDRFLEYAPDGRTVDGLYEQAAISAKTRMSRGLMPQLALQQVSALVLTMTLTTLSDTVRSVVAADMTRRPQVTGYVRQLVPPSCSRCVILAGRWYRWNEGFQRHPGCDCIHIPAREDNAGDLTTDPYVYFNSLTKEQQDRLFGKADAQAIRDGADIYRVVNIRERGLATAKGARKFGTPYRLTIDDIYEQAKSRDDAIRLMRQEGFITGPQVRGGNILGRFYEGYGELGKGGRAAAAREAVLEARRTGVRDPLNRYTMTSAERRYYDANYRLKYYERTGKIPATIGPNSADLGVKLRAPSPGEVDALYRQVDQLKNLALQATAPSGLTRLVLALDDLSLDDLRRLEVVALAKGGKRAQAAAGRGSRGNSGSRGAGRGPATAAGAGGANRPPGGRVMAAAGDDRWWEDDDRVPKMDEFLLEKVMRGVPGTTVGGHGYGMTPKGKRGRNTELPSDWTDQDTRDAFEATLRSLSRDFSRNETQTIEHEHNGVVWRLRFSPLAPKVEESVEFYPVGGDRVRTILNGKLVRRRS